jgi:hypothetical protein
LYQTFVVQITWLSRVSISSSAPHSERMLPPEVDSYDHIIGTNGIHIEIALIDMVLMVYWYYVGTNGIHIEMALIDMVLMVSTRLQHARHAFSKVLSIVPLLNKCTMALTLLIFFSCVCMVMATARRARFLKRIFYCAFTKCTWHWRYWFFFPFVCVVMAKLQHARPAFSKVLSRCLCMVNVLWPWHYWFFFLAFVC